MNPQTQSSLSTEDYVRSTFQSGQVFFVQVGSNDGMHGDPIYPLAVGNPKWSGILIEPVGYAFQRLRENYGNHERFAFENVAIGATRGVARFYFVSEMAKLKLEHLPEWYDQLGSFDRNHILKHLDGCLAPFIEEAEIDCVPLAEILSKHAVQRIDLLHIDAEGSDWVILSQFDLRRYQPRMIIFEYFHLSEQDLEQAERRLSDAGYRLARAGLDVIATLGQADDKVG